jgi:hypothetical protein
MPKALADVGAADHEILAIIRPPPDEDVDMWVVGVPVVNRDPIEPGAEIAFGIGHQFTREGPQVLELGGILGGHDEPEMMAVVPAAFGKGPLVRVVRPGVEHAGISTIMRDPVALQIGDLPRQCSGTEPAAPMSRHADLCQHLT